MATSFVGSVPFVVNHLVLLSPRSVLDIGIGFGRWGHLAREFLDVMHNRHLPEQWQARIEGIEVYEPYLQPHQRHLYDAIHAGDARQVIHRLGRYDMAIIGDMLEHLDKQPAWELFHAVMERVETGLIMNLPLGEEWLREVGHDNPHEDHRSWWVAEEFAPWRPEVELHTVGNGWTHASFFIKSAEYRYPALVASASQEDRPPQERADLLSEAVNTVPDRHEAYLQLTHLLLGLGQKREALDLLERMVIACPAYAQGPAVRDQVRRELLEHP